MPLTAKAGVTDLLLHGEADEVVEFKISISLIALLLSARLALGPFLMGEENLFPRAELGSLLGSPSGKCLEQTLKWGLSHDEDLQPLATPLLIGGKAV